MQPYIQSVKHLFRFLIWIKYTTLSLTHIFRFRCGLKNTSLSLTHLLALSLVNYSNLWVYVFTFTYMNAFIFYRIRKSWWMHQPIIGNEVPPTQRVTKQKEICNISLFFFIFSVKYSQTTLQLNPDNKIDLDQLYMLFSLPYVYESSYLIT